LVEFLEERGWGILNGCIVEEEEGEFTFTGGKGNTIDYVLGDEEMREKVSSLKIRERIDSDHQPVVVRIKKDIKSAERERKGNRGRMRREIWNEEGREAFRNKMKGTELEERRARMETDQPAAAELR